MGKRLVEFNAEPLRHLIGIVNIVKRLPIEAILNGRKLASELLIQN